MSYCDKIIYLQKLPSWYQCVIIWLLLFNSINVINSNLNDTNSILNDVQLKVSVDPNIYVNDTGENPRTLVVRDLAKQVTIFCEANCPVEWKLEKFRYGSFSSDLSDSVKFFSERQFTDFWNASTYKYSSELTLKGSSPKLTGNYTCRCASGSEGASITSQSIYVYWEGSSGTYLLQAGDKRTLYTQDMEDPFLRIFCGVSQPMVSVYLFMNKTELPPNGYSVFQDIDGFRVHSSLLNKDVETEFVCSLKSRLNERTDDSELAMYEVNYEPYVKKSTTLRHMNKLTQDSNGLVNYDFETNTLICCSPHKTHRQVGFYCRSHQECRFRAYRLQWGNNAGEGNRTCSWYKEGFGASDGAVVFRCADEGRKDLIVEAEAEKFYGIDATSYYSIEEAERNRRNVISLKLNGNDSIRLQGSSMIFQCQHSTYLFSHGVVWTLTYKNGTQILINTSVKRLKEEGDFEIEKAWNEGGNKEFLQIRIHNTNLDVISCHAPLWNSAEWWNSTFQLNLQQSLVPTFDKSQDEEIVSAEDIEVKLQCIVTGYPKPQIKWHKQKKDLMVWLDESSSTIQLLNSSADDNFSTPIIRLVSTLSFIMTKNREGSYICEAKSDVGEAQKTFVVWVKDLTVVKVIGITTGVILVLLIILGCSLKKIAQQRKAIRFLTKQDIQEFEKGNPEALAEFHKNNDYSTNNAHHLLPYNTDYEVPKEKLLVDYGQILGQGTYGMVLKGKLKRLADEIVVAVKTIKPNEDASHFKVLLCEVKIMAYIGSHKNVVSLVGAYTRNIRNRELLVATEFCEHGNLLEILRNGRSTYEDMLNLPNYQNAPIEILPANSNSQNAGGSNMYFTTFNLLNWAAQVATGMEFLGVKRVIHGDLACRNVLVGADLLAKVGDFGLSKHLFQYSTYQKKTVQLLPWRWMAFESLTDMTFSLQSDVWAFGVTLWEIFTLAQTPYPGMVWDEVFIKKLQQEFRLPKPAYATEEIYELILSCWVMDSKRRPNFSVLKNCINEIIQNLEDRVHLAV